MGNTSVLSKQMWSLWVTLPLQGYPQIHVCGISTARNNILSKDLGKSYFNNNGNARAQFRCRFEGGVRLVNIIIPHGAWGKYFAIVRNFHLQKTHSS